MGKFDSFYEAKNYIIDMMRTEIVGPVKEDEILDSAPLNTYVAGILWARPLNSNGNSSETEEEREYEMHRAVLEGEPIEEGEEEKAVPDEIAIEEFQGDIVANSSIRKPSTMGISVMLSPETKNVQVSFSFAKYEHSEEEREYGNEGKKRVYYLYSRKAYKFNLTFDFSKESVEYLPLDNEKLVGYNITIKATKRMGKAGESRLVTFSVSNDLKAQSKDIVLNESALFQCKLNLRTEQGEFLPLDPGYSSVYDVEDEILSMQYKDVLNFAQGHGCATAVSEKDGKCEHVWSEFIPVFELKQMKPPEVEDKELFSLRFLHTGTKQQIISRLKNFIELYKHWADQQKKRGETEAFTKYKRAVKDCLRKIEICTERISEGIKCLAENDIAWKSFVFANKAMYKQRVSMALIKGGINNASEFSKKMSEPCWYPFQLFYLLMIIPDFIDSDSPFKDVVDLLWFPTGGGKTEAYLAVSAFIIFYERLRKQKSVFGTTIIMRYTLRLLTIQQFERASALICACENVRKEERLGGNEISIGLWIGGGSAPNTIEDAIKALEKLRAGEQLYELADPVQITKCPYCGKKLNALNYHIENNRMEIMCDNCGHLPVYIVDTDIYEKMPTLVVSTVDKFARIVWEERAGRIFGCNVDATKPRLIIQDELHLISGPLGTLTGLYETAVDKLCWDDNGVKPKIIASTATVKNAAYQIKGLYNRNHFQFPPSGLDNKDSFFAEQATKDDKPSRFYVGLSEQGGSMVDLMIRVFSALSLSDFYLEKSGVEEKVLDQYYTIIGYFNAIKDLGTASTILRERMYNYISSLINGKFCVESEKLNVEKLENGKYKEEIKMKAGELTSRKNSSEIRGILDDLNIGYKLDDKDMAYKYVLSSNMFSVGVDIDRLGLMAVYGQPKSNADYIQATSRVGRSNPGIVFCLYNAFRSRDRSHYERFNQYHSCFYKHVESTSVTPFSMRSIEKGLHAVFIALVRHLVSGMSSNDSARLFNANNSKVCEIEEYLLNRIKEIQPAALDGAIAFLEDFKYAWMNAGSSLVYDVRKKGRVAGEYISLLQSSENDNEDFTVLNSVRNVESSSNVFIVQEV
ncbi:MAG: hypothetical protein IJY84_04325 [Clostridia bacterium]|nr:hypothetical protein [Clostridia bacterium]